ncbi:hypothetical protein ACQ4PT_009292 [Festuca glaucescens]
MAVSLGLATFISGCVASFVVSIVACLLCGQKREDDDGADGSLAARVAAAVAPPAAVVELGYFSYSAEGRRASEKLVCAICLEVFEHGDACGEVPD